MEKKQNPGSAETVQGIWVLFCQGGSPALNHGVSGRYPPGLLANPCQHLLNPLHLAQGGRR